MISSRILSYGSEGSFLKHKVYFKFISFVLQVQDQILLSIKVLIVALVQAYVALAQALVALVQANPTQGGLILAVRRQVVVGAGGSRYKMPFLAKFQ